MQPFCQGESDNQIITDTRVIAAKTYITRHQYNAADRVTQTTYPSGRIVIYARNSLGQVTGVTSKQNATAAGKQRGRFPLISVCKRFSNTTSTSLS
jgi:YD repeat-containing protein